MEVTLTSQTQSTVGNAGTESHWLARCTLGHCRADCIGSYAIAPSRKTQIAQNSLHIFTPKPKESFTEMFILAYGGGPCWAKVVTECIKCLYKWCIFVRHILIVTIFAKKIKKIKIKSLQSGESLCKIFH